MRLGAPLGCSFVFFLFWVIGVDGIKMQKLCVFVGIRRRDHVENVRLENLTHKDGYDDLRGLPGRRVFSIFRFRFFNFFQKVEWRVLLRRVSLIFGLV